MSFRILMTCAGGGLAPQAIQYLRKHSRHQDVFVVAVDSAASAVGRYFANAFEIVPKGVEQGYVAALAEVAERYSVDLVLPGSDEEALAAARDRHLIERNGCKLACADIGVLETLADKASTYAALQGFGLPTPRWHCVNSVDALRAAVNDLLKLELDVVVKPAASRGGRGVSVIRADVKGDVYYNGGREVHLDIQTFWNKYLQGYEVSLPVIVMERLYEPVFDLDMLGRNGQLLRSVARRRINPAVPNDGHIIERRQDLYDLAPKIVSAFNLSWLYDCDIMLDQSGAPQIIEINPRPSGSTAVAIAAGVPLLDDLISLAREEELPPVDIPYGNKVIPYTALTSAKQHS